jgi:hypothetical protein
MQKAVRLFDLQSGNDVVSDTLQIGDITLWSFPRFSDTKKRHYIVSGGVQCQAQHDVKSMIRNSNSMHFG